MTVFLLGMITGIALAEIMHYNGSTQAAACGGVCRHNPRQTSSQARTSWPEN